MLNRVELIGNLGQDPEMRESRAGAAIANLRIATTHRAKGQDGTWEERTEWHTVIAFGNLADNVGKYLNKGRQVFVEGRIQTRKWEDKNGNTRYSTEIVANEIKFLGKRDEDGGGRQRSRQQENGHQEETSAPKSTPAPKNTQDWDEEIPF